MNSSDSPIQREVRQKEEVLGGSIPIVMKNHFTPGVFAALIGLSGASLVCGAEPGNGLAPEVPGLNLADNLYQLEAQLPDLREPYISAAPVDNGDGMRVGRLGEDGGDRAVIEEYARAIAEASGDERVNNVDSMLIGYRGRLVFESYYRRGRANFPHYQMSITKAYTALAIGRAVELGFLKMEDLDKPVVGFLKEVDVAKLVKGAETITLAQALQMSSGIRLGEGMLRELLRKPEALRGQAEIAAYLQHSEAIPEAGRKFKYQEPDTAIAMQVLNAVVPGGAQEFIRKELLGRMGITQYRWEAAMSGLPKSAAGSSLLSRDMVKVGMMVLYKGRWLDEQLIPEAYIARATSPNVHVYGSAHYGFYWWVEDFDVGGRSYRSIEGRGAGGQFIFIFPALELVVVVTSHDKGMGDMLKTLPQRVIPAFTR